MSEDVLALSARLAGQDPDFIALAEARALALRFVYAHWHRRRAATVYLRLRRLLGFNTRPRFRVLWSDVFEQAVVLLSDNAVLRRAIEREVTDIEAAQAAGVRHRRMRRVG